MCLYNKLWERVIKSMVGTSYVSRGNKLVRDIIVYITFPHELVTRSHDLLTRYHELTTYFACPQGGCVNERCKKISINDLNIGPARSRANKRKRTSERTS